MHIYMHIYMHIEHTHITYTYNMHHGSTPRGPDGRTNWGWAIEQHIREKGAGTGEGAGTGAEAGAEDVTESEEVKVGGGGGRGGGGGSHYEYESFHRKRSDTDDTSESEGEVGDGEIGGQNKGFGDRGQIGGEGRSRREGKSDAELRWEQQAQAAVHMRDVSGESRSTKSSWVTDRGAGTGIRERQAIQAEDEGPSPKPVTPVTPVTPVRNKVVSALHSMAKTSSSMDLI